jgi:hypothetical protein
MTHMVYPCPGWLANFTCGVWCQRTQVQNLMTDRLCQYIFYRSHDWKTPDFLVIAKTAQTPAKSTLQWSHPYNMSIDTHLQAMHNLLSTVSHYSEQHTNAPLLGWGTIYRGAWTIRCVQEPQFPQYIFYCNWYLKIRCSSSTIFMSTGNIFVQGLRH